MSGIFSLVAYDMQDYLCNTYYDDIAGRNILLEKEMRKRLYIISLIVQRDVFTHYILNKVSQNSLQKMKDVEHNFPERITFTRFHNVYKRHTNFAVEYVNTDVDNMHWARFNDRNNNNQVSISKYIVNNISPKNNHKPNNHCESKNVYRRSNNHKNDNHKNDNYHNNNNRSNNNNNRGNNMSKKYR